MALTDPRLTLDRHADVDAFEKRALPYLMSREAENNLFLGICSQIREGRYSDHYLALVERGDEVVAAAFRTPPFQLGLSHIADPASLPLLAEDVRDAFESLPGVLGARDAARSFAEIWQEISGQTFAVGMQQRIYQAAEVNAVQPARGEMRDATQTDRDVLISWVRAFHDEVGGVMASAEELVDYRLGETDGGLVVWSDPEPVSMAGWGAPTPNGNRIGPVFTPPDLRGRGYASSCVSALTRRLLSKGRRFVFLFTDLANPTSNSIYQRIGYGPVCDVDQYVFSS